MRASKRHARPLARWTGPASLTTAIVGSLLLSASFSDAAEAKTPGSTYCFYGTCHRVKSLSEMERLVGTSVTLSASHYDSCARDRYNPCGLTSSGERFSPDRPDNVASPIYPDGTTLLVWSPVNRGAAVVRVNNAGPYWGSRKLDLSRATADKLGFGHRGVAKLEVMIVDAPDRTEATYSRGRKYDRVPGFIGEFASLDAAAAGMRALMALEAAHAARMVPIAEPEAKPVRIAFNDPFEPGKETGLAVESMQTTSIAAAEAVLEMERVAATMSDLVMPAERTVALLEQPSLDERKPAAGDVPAADGEPALRVSKVAVAERREVSRHDSERAAAPRPRQALANRQIALTEARSRATLTRRHNDLVAGPPNDHSVFSERAQAERSTRGKMAGSAGGVRRAQLRVGRPAA